MFACFPGKKQSFRFLAPHLYGKYWSEALSGNEECTRSPRHERHESFKKAFRKVSTSNTRTLHVPSRSYMSTLTYPMTVFQTIKKTLECQLYIPRVSRISAMFVSWPQWHLHGLHTLHAQSPPRHGTNPRALKVKAPSTCRRWRSKRWRWWKRSKSKDFFGGFRWLLWLLFIFSTEFTSWTPCSSFAFSMV